MNGPAGDGFQEMRLRSWEGFQEFVFQSKVAFDDFIWRGQRCADWHLESVLRRRLQRKGVPSSEWQNQLRRLETQFRLAARGRRGSHPPSLSDEGAAWALGRHYGLATPLLDWTKSPFVAAFFAFVEESEGTEPPDLRAVWGFRISQDVKNNSGIRIIEPETDENVRLISQRGVFTWITDLQHDDLEHWVRREFAGVDNRILIKITLPNHARVFALRMLNRMNINHLTLFPDLEGAARFTNMSLEIDAY